MRDTAGSCSTSVNSITSAASGLRLLVGLHNQVKGDGAVVLCAVSSKVQSILDLTKVRNVLPQYSSRADALDAVKSR